MTSDPTEFRRAEDGGLTIFGMFLFLTTCAIGAIALDVTHLYSARTQLQVTADLAAHAAIYTRETKTPDQARTAAISAVRFGMPTDYYGNAVTDAHVVFGNYDYDTGAFTPSLTSRQAVRVNAQRVSAENNPVQSFLFRTIGIDDWDVGAQATYAVYRPGCFLEGLVAEGMVDVQSNNGFYAGFCIHSNDHVSVNQNNFFEPGTVVSMPDTADLELPSSGFVKNVGLEAALRSGAYRLRLINRLPSMIDQLESVTTNSYDGYNAVPSYITSSTPITINLTGPNKLTPAMLTPGRVHRVNCSGATVTVDAGTYARVAIVTNCQLKFNNNVYLEDAIFATRNTGTKSVNASILNVGRNDNCAPGGGASIWTLGGIDIASTLEAHNAQFLARGDIHFAANAFGLRGISMQAGGQIHGTSNMQMGLCETGMEGVLQMDYYRLVE